MCVKTIEATTALPLNPPRTGPENLAAVFSQNMAAVYAFLYRRLGNREDAEDLTSEIFLKAAR